MSASKSSRVTLASGKPAASFLLEQSSLKMVSTGCGLLDCVLGGGYPLGRIVNIAGDRSSGKTLLAIEACANFLREYPNGHIRYIEAEAAFDLRYAAALGMPVETISFGDEIVTVEEVFDDIIETTERLTKEKRAGLYVVDSLDALSNKAEVEKDIDAGSYNAEKAKKMSELFRRTAKKVEAAQMLTIIISQVRDKIGVTFGETQTRSGGRALDFYASQILWLSEVGKLKKTIRGQERTVGVKVKARCKKNKVGLPFREAQFPIIFGYGVDDVVAAVEWLSVLPEFDWQRYGLNERSWASAVSKLRDAGGTEYAELRALLAKDLNLRWSQVETEFLPKSRKY